MNISFTHSVVFLSVCLLLSCNSDSNENLELKSPDLLAEQNTSAETPDHETIEYINEPCLCFFSMSDKEYDTFLQTSNINVKWEFDIMFKRFKREAKSIRTSLTKHNIKSFYTTKPLITFVSKQNDTIIFKRKDEDYFIGQIFFFGSDTIIIEEGLMKIKQLEEKIINFFQLEEDFKIKAVYEKVVTPVKQKTDTIKPVLTDTIE